jgi:hypothetical protein
MPGRRRQPFEAPVDNGVTRNLKVLGMPSLTSVQLTAARAALHGAIDNAFGGPVPNPAPETPADQGIRVEVPDQGAFRNQVLGGNGGTAMSETHRRALRAQMDSQADAWDPNASGWSTASYDQGNTLVMAGPLAGYHADVSLYQGVAYADLNPVHEGRHDPVPE